MREHDRDLSGAGDGRRPSGRRRLVRASGVVRLDAHVARPFARSRCAARSMCGLLDVRSGVDGCRLPQCPAETDRGKASTGAFDAVHAYRCGESDRSGRPTSIGAWREAVRRYVTACAANRRRGKRARSARRCSARLCPSRALAAQAATLRSGRGCLPAETGRDHGMRNAPRGSRPASEAVAELR
jgi:hypothetical protein